MSGAVNAVLTYLTNQNRPYSVNDITQNLHKEFGKTAIQKALDDLVQKGKIYEKAYGKQKVYSVIQSAEVCNPEQMNEELIKLDAEINEITESLKNSEVALKTSEATLKELNNLPTTREAILQNESLEKEVKDLKTKLNNLTSTKVKIVPPADKVKIQKNHESVTKEYRKRKRICMDIINSILENCPKNKKSLIEEIGIQTDEEVEFQVLTK